MSFRTGFHKGKLGIGLSTSMGMDDGTGNPRYPLDINGDIRLTGAIVDASGNPIEMMAQQRSFPEAISNEDIDIGDGTAFFESNVKITGDLDFTGTLYNDGVVFGGGKFEDSATAGDIYYNGGNVGIGTTTPDAKLEVSGDLNIAATNDSWSTSGKGLYLRFYGGTVDTGYIQCIDRSNNDTQYKLKYMASVHEFSTRPSTAAGDPIRMTIATDGNVGIGTTTPNATLHIRNDTNSSGTGDAYIPNIPGGGSYSYKPTECLRLQGTYTDKGCGALIRFTNYHASGSNPSNDEYNLGGIAGYDVKSDWGGGLCFWIPRFLLRKNTHCRR